LNRDPADSRFENLVFLCLDHHDDYDGNTSQSKGYLPEEVREYRDKLYELNAEKEAVLRHASETTELEPIAPTGEYETLRKRFAGDLERFRSDWRFPLWQVANEPELFAYKASNRMDGVCLIERIDLPDGRIVIVCEAAPGNPGNSITNSVETICLQVCERFDIPASRLVWIEHYEWFGIDDWKLVEFDKMPPAHLFDDPTWTEITPLLWADLQLRPKKRRRIIGGSLESKVTKLFPWPPAE
jgi:hypothetical protein